MEGKAHMTRVKRSFEECSSAYPEETSDKFPEENSCKKPKTETEDAESDNFERLYQTAFEFIQKVMKVSEEELAKGNQTVKVSFHYSEGKRFTDIDFTKSENLCAYFRRFSQLSTMLSRSKILLAFENCDELKSRFNCDTLDVMCVGGGPGFEIVGLCSALHEKTTCKKLNLSVVEPAKRWESFLGIVGFLLREGDFGRSCEMFKGVNASVKFYGVPAQDTQNLPYSEALKKADIVLMKGVLSILYEKEEEVGKAVVAGMKNGALLLVIDSPYYKVKNDQLVEIYTSSTKPMDEENGFYIDATSSNRSNHSNARITVYKKNSI